MATAEAAARRGLADMLGLLAAPAFLSMAVLTVLEGENSSFLLCSGHGSAWDATGMGPMYLLMTAVHLAPWLKKRRELGA